MKQYFILIPKKIDITKELRILKVLTLYKVTPFFSYLHLLLPSELRLCTAATRKTIMRPCVPNMGLASYV